MNRNHRNIISHHQHCDKHSHRHHHGDIPLTHCCCRNLHVAAIRWFGYRCRQSCNACRRCCACQTRCRGLDAGRRAHQGHGYRQGHLILPIDATTIATLRHCRLRHRWIRWVIGAVRHSRGDCYKGCWIGRADGGVNDGRSEGGSWASTLRTWTLRRRCAVS